MVEREVMLNTDVTAASDHKAKKKPSALSFQHGVGTVGRKIASEISDRKKLIDAFSLTSPDSTSLHWQARMETLPYYAEERTKKSWKRFSSDSETDQPLTVYKIPGK